MMFGTDDLRQIGVVMRNEITKFLRSRKFVLYLALVVLILVLMTAVPYILGDGLQGSAGSIFSSYISYASLLVVLAATLFASYTLVSEFEERTALILFTRPIRRTTIFIGKFLACFLLEAVVMVLYYAVAVIIAFAVAGEVPSSVLPSLAMCLAYVFAASGVAMLVSSVFKKGGTSAVVTFVTVLLIIPVLGTVMAASGVDTWFMLNDASNAITYSIPEYVEEMNQSLIELGQALGIDMSGSVVEAADCVKSGAAMIGWGVVTLLLSWLRFVRKEF